MSAPAFDLKTWTELLLIQNFKLLLLFFLKLQSWSYCNCFAFKFYNLHACWSLIPGLKRNCLLRTLIWNCITGLKKMQVNDFSSGLYFWKWVCRLGFLISKMVNRFLVEDDFRFKGFWTWKWFIGWFSLRSIDFLVCFRSGKCISDFLKWRLEKEIGKKKNVLYIGWIYLKIKIKEKQG